MRTLYFDCFAGASGNMILGALLSLGIERDELLRQLRLMDIGDFDIEVTVVDRSGINALHVEVKVPHEHIHRHLSDIEKIIRGSKLSDGVKDRSVKIFANLAAAEAKIHGIDVQKVHFHEVGAKDAIIDVVGSCIGFELLGVERFSCSKIHVGSGFVKMAHGTYPVPPPAVAELLLGKPIYSGDIEGELITPTGAAIIATLCDTYGQISEMTVEIAGYGAGTREYKDFPNVIRLMLGNSIAVSNGSGETDNLLVLETNLDDVSPQVLGFVMERAFELGCLDCWFTPIQMKKNRPATMVSILCAEDKRSDLTELLYRETTTLGIRVRTVERECLPREMIRVETEYGAVDVKVARLSGEIVNVMPEYDQVKLLANKHEVAFRRIRDAVDAQLNKHGISAKAVSS
jgi:uncharacterized protein (TIGR00299 family) protein